MHSNSPKSGLIGWVTDDEARAPMASDPDATPMLTTDPPVQWFRPPIVRNLRRKLRLTQQIR